MTDRVCIACGSPMLGVRRSDARFCSGTCRRDATRFGGADAVRLVKACEKFWQRYRTIRRSDTVTARRSARGSVSAAMRATGARA